MRRTQDPQAMKSFQLTSKLYYSDGLTLWAQVSERDAKSGEEVTRKCLSQIPVRTDGKSSDIGISVCFRHITRLGSSIDSQKG